MPNFESGDNTLPSFSYNPQERGEMIKKGLSEEEIAQMEARRNLDLAEAQLNKELDQLDQAA